MPSVDVFTVVAFVHVRSYFWGCCYINEWNKPDEKTLKLLPLVTDLSAFSPACSPFPVSVLCSC